MSYLQPDISATWYREAPDDRLASVAGRRGIEAQDRAELRARGYQSVVAFPIFDRSTRAGALVALHADQACFGDLERSFLADIAVVVSQAVAVDRLGWRP